jgi:hypothetical protein
MKTPICTFDARSGSLCSLCENKLRTGELTQEDVEGSIRLTKLSANNQDLDKLSLMSSKRVDEEFLLFFRAPDISFLRSNEHLIEKIQEEFHGNAWLIEADSPPRKFLENLFFPIRIGNSNMIWLPDGHKVTQVTVARKDFTRVSEKVEKIRRIAEEIKDIELLVEVLGD